MSGSTASRELEPSSSAELLADLGIALVEAGDVGEMLQRLADAAREVSGARYAAIGVLNRDGTGLDDFITSGLDAETREGIGAPPEGRGLLGAIITEGTAVRVDDIGADPRSVGFPPGHPPMSSFLGLPIRLAGQVFGNIYVTDRQGADAFSASDERLLETLAAYAAIAIRGAQLQAERQRWIDGLEGVCSISGAIGRSLELAELMPEATRQTRALLDCETVGIARFADGRIKFPFAHGPDALRLEALDLAESDTEGLCEFVEQALPGKHCFVRPLATDETVGALAVVDSVEFDSWQKSVVEVLAIHIAGAVGNAEQFSEERRRLSDEADRRAADIELRLEREAQARAVLAQEDERARVARELHDETGQLLTGVSLRLTALSDRLDEAAAAELLGLREHVKDVQESMRQILRRLRPADLEDGLGAALRELGRRAEEASDCRVSVQVGPLPPTADEVELVLFRVAQEALTNVTRHSRATQASVVLATLGDQLRLTIEDDGVGFEPTASTDRMGLAGVAERVQLVGGSLRISSSPGRGTAILVDVEARAAADGEEA